MELDDLKKQLNLTINSDHEQRSADNIALLMKGKAVSLLQKIRKSILLEILISVCFGIACGIVLLSIDSWMYYILFSVFAVIAIAFIAVLYFLLKKVNATISSGTVKQNLMQLMTIIREYCKRYLQLTLFLLPLSFAFGMWLSYNDPSKVLQPIQLSTAGILVAVFIVIGAVIYFFTRWYLQKLYGKYLQELSELAEELDD